MEKISAHIGRQNYKVDVQGSKKTLIIDEPLELGGQDLGLNPKELLAASLGACTSITLKMYANHKGWDLTDVNIDVTFDWDKETSKSFFTREIELIGNLDDAQRERLLKIADSCPVHKVLMNPTEVETVLL
ncbi:OsmC family protein [Flavobacterium sp. SM15]|uniref:OsmC family protein n=1 Tax=Flavobacterium sp. SM15 TaxID=2908005 RepID=UPI001EDC8807|nr:OsmC family protein [Flavobacterium sp. SM15]MCG2611655.1 OsmC family protein [Flavobacterium sp. SM15]